MKTPAFRDRTKQLMIRSHIAKDLDKNVGVGHVHEMIHLKNNIFKSSLNEFSDKLRRNDNASGLEVFDMFPDLKKPDLFDDFEDEPQLFGLRRNLSGILRSPRTAAHRTPRPQQPARFNIRR
jgi:hypothetical protein